MKGDMQYPQKSSVSAISLRFSILAPLALSLAMLVAAFTFSLFQQEEDFTKELVDGSFISAQKIYATAVKTDTDKLSTALEFIVLDAGLRHAMLAKDRNALLQQSLPIFQKLRQEYGITHFYFHAPKRDNFLRVHQPDRFGDTINRFTAMQAEATGKPAAGLELGPLGTFTLRVVFPWYEGKRLIGYVELGEEIEHILKQINMLAGIDLYLSIKKQYISQPAWLDGMKMLGR
ncbi:MAG: cache domain-containing protein, partial [Rhodocyclaceae bacterium]|nr:cache domain-containing protein [Rhodocyclaceae bacterium]